jgi:hypothetical protein
MLQRLVMSGLIVGLISVVSTPIVRAEMMTDGYGSTSVNSDKLQPFSLVTLAYQGYFKDEGIPSNGTFMSGVSGGQITAKKLVESAIKAGRLPEAAINDLAYLHYVENQLQFLDKN